MQNVKKIPSCAPFRPDGRGAKQFAKAIEISKTRLNCEFDLEENNEFVIYKGKTPCIAKIISFPFNRNERFCVNPLRVSPKDNSLLIPWEGHTWLAEKDELVFVKVHFTQSIFVKVLTLIKYCFYPF
jgi:hypothetical protein